MKVMMVAAMMAMSAFALEQESNDFWDTTGYTGVAPATAESSTLSKPLDCWTTLERPVGPLTTKFTSFQVGTIITVR